MGQLAGLQRSRAEAALLRERQALAQYQVERALVTSLSAVAALPEIVQLLQSEGNIDRAWISLGMGASPARVITDGGTTGRPEIGASHNLLRREADDRPPAWVRVHDPSLRDAQRSGSGRRVLPGADHVPRRGPRGSVWIARRRTAGTPGRGDTRVLAAAADQIGQALERDRLADEATTAEIARRSEAAKTALLDSVSHDLRTPLASIRAAAGSLMDPALEPGCRRPVTSAPR